MQTHRLKLYPEFYNDVESGKKSFELRKNDRNFKVGDWIVFEEWNWISECYTGSSFSKKISYILKDSSFGMQSGMAILGLEDISDAERELAADNLELVSVIKELLAQNHTFDLTDSNLIEAAELGFAPEIRQEAETILKARKAIKKI